MQYKQKLKKIIQTIRAIRDIDRRLIGMLIVGVFGVTVVFSSLRVVTQNYQLLQKIAVLEEENRLIEIQNRNKEIENQYYASPEFAELKVRRVNGKAAGGGRIYTIDDSVGLQALETKDEQQVEPLTAAADSRP